MGSGSALRTILYLDCTGLCVTHSGVVGDLSAYELVDLEPNDFSICYPLPILLFILANLLFPVKWKVPLDLKAYYFSICPKFFFFTICLALTALLQNVFLLDYTLWEQPVQLGVIMLFSILLIVRTEKAWVHYAIALGLLLILIGNQIFSPQLLVAP
jgi:hypothetical protein